MLHFSFCQHSVFLGCTLGMFLKGTKQSGHIGSNTQHRLKWQHVRHKNSRSCHSVRKVSYQISKHLCKPTLLTAGRQIVDIGQSGGHDGPLPHYTAFTTQPGFLRERTSRSSCHGTALSSLPRPCALWNAIRTCWIGTSTRSSWPPITSAATCCARKPGSLHHSGPAPACGQRYVRTWWYRMLSTQETWRQCSASFPGGPQSTSLLSHTEETCAGPLLGKVEHQPVFRIFSVNVHV